MFGKLLHLNFRLSLLLALGIFLSANQLYAAGGLCSKLWALNPLAKSEKKVQVSSVEYVEPSPQWIPLNELKADSLRFTEAKKGVYEQVFLLERKKANNWNSHVKRTNFQGDPRMIIESLGDNIAKRLGFAIISKDSIQYPSAFEYHARLKDLLNERPSLKRFFPFKFHSENEKLDLYSYLKLIANHTSIPLSPKGHGLIHDLNWHSLSPGLLSPVRIENLKNSLKLFLEFIDFVNQQEKISNWEKKKIDEHLENLAYAADSLLGAPIKVIYKNIDLQRLEVVLGAYFTHRPEDALPNSPRLYHLFLEHKAGLIKKGKPNPEQLTEEIRQNYIDFQKLI